MIFRTAVMLLVCAALQHACYGQGYVCTLGGADASSVWHRSEAFVWMVEKGHHGPVVIVSTLDVVKSDEPDSRETVFLKFGAASVRTLVVNEKNAESQDVYDAIVGASVVVLRGSGPGSCMKAWKGTRTEKAIRAVYDKGGVVAGGADATGGFGGVAFDGAKGGLSGAEVLSDGAHPHISLAQGFLVLVPGVMFDTVAEGNGTMARLGVLLAHCRDDLHIEPVGVGLDSGTAFCVSPDGIGEVIGDGIATIVELAPGTRSVLTAGEPPAVTPLWCSLVKGHTAYDTVKQRFVDEAECGPEDVQDESVEVRMNGTTPDPLFQGMFKVGQSLEATNRLSLPSGVSEVGGWIAFGRYRSLYVGADSCSKSVNTSERVAQVLVDHHPPAVVLLTPGNSAAVSAAWVVRIERGFKESDWPSAKGISAMVLDYTCTRKMIGKGSSAPRGKLHILPPGWSLDLAERVVTRPVAPEKPKVLASPAETP